MSNMIHGIPKALLEQIQSAPRTGRRRLVALVGPPASGKSTLATKLVEALATMESRAQVVPMDGFHLDNRLLAERGLMRRKGSPDTFDVRGLLSLVSRLPDDANVIFPLFDRARDIAIAGAGQVCDDCETLIIEGNYLLYDAPLWCELSTCWDFAIRLEVSTSMLRERLIDRWLANGLSQEQAQSRAEENDLVNAALIARHQLPADVSLVPAAKDNEFELVCGF
jgi:fructokinase